jgi:hypothetical protein
MKTKLVKRYWCDFCNRAGLQERAMARHEQHCTMNPARTCRVCALIAESTGEEASAPLADLMALLPDCVEYEGDGWSNPQPAYVAFCAALDAAIPVLRKAANGCPACFMAALRQKKIPVPMAEGFDFKAEMQQIFSDRNDFREEQRGY